MPVFESGGLVEKTGLAVVDKGEYIIPAPGSAAAIEAASLTGHTVVNYYFPVEIIVVGASPTPTIESSRRVFGRG